MIACSLLSLRPFFTDWTVCLSVCVTGGGAPRKTLQTPFKPWVQSTAVGGRDYRECCVHLHIACEPRATRLPSTTTAVPNSFSDLYRSSHPAGGRTARRAPPSPHLVYPHSLTDRLPQHPHALTSPALHPFTRSRPLPPPRARATHRACAVRHTSASSVGWSQRAARVWDDRRALHLELTYHGVRAGHVVESCQLYAVRPRSARPPTPPRRAPHMNAPGVGETRAPGRESLQSAATSAYVVTITLSPPLGGSGAQRP